MQIINGLRTLRMRSLSEKKKRTVFRQLALIKHGYAAPFFRNNLFVIRFVFSIWF